MITNGAYIQESAGLVFGLVTKGNSTAGHAFKGEAK
jgi:hypothetical protein